MMASRFRRRKSDAGFTLAELLVVLIVIVVLVAIAVPAYLHQRDRAFDAAVKSDLRNSAKVAETNLVDAGANGYASESSFVQTADELSSKSGKYVGYADADSYVMYGQSRSGRIFVLRSDGSGSPVELTAGGSVAPSTILASVAVLAAAAAPNEADLAELPELTSTPPAGISRPYAAVTWGYGTDGVFVRDSRFFGDEDPGAGGPGGGGALPVGAAVFEYDTRLSNAYSICPGQTVALPIAQLDGVSVDWGDGSAPTSTTSHTYATPGVYRVAVTGKFGTLGGTTSLTNTPAVSQSQGCLTGVLAFDAPTHGTTKMSWAFFNAFNLRKVENVRTTGVTDMASAFEGASVFDGDLSSWDTSAVTTLRNTFKDSGLTDGGLSSWNTSNVTSLSGTFNRAKSFNGDISGWNTAKVTTMHSTFSGATAFNRDVSRWNIGAVSEFDSMFYAASSFDRDLSSWVPRARATASYINTLAPGLTSAKLPAVWR